MWFLFLAAVAAATGPPTILNDREHCFGRGDCGKERTTAEEAMGGKVARGRSRKNPLISTYIFIGQKIGAELQVIIKIKGATGFESGPEGRHRWGFRKFPHALDTTELTLGILLGHFGATAGTAMVVVGMHLGGMLRVLVVMLLLVVVGVQEGRHDG